MTTVDRMLILWRTVLKHDEFAIDSDLYDVGGHSLTAVRLLAHIEHEFGIRLSLGEVLRAGTPAAMSALLDGAMVDTTTGAARPDPDEG